MNLKKMSYEQQVDYLRQLLRSKGSPLAGPLALCLFRQHLVSKHFPGSQFKPALRWYLGQLAKIYIRKIFNEAKANLNYFAEIGLVEETPCRAPTKKQEMVYREFHLDEELLPALRFALEERLGKEYVSKMVSSAKYCRPPESGVDNTHDKKSEVIKDGKSKRNSG